MHIPKSALIGITALGISASALAQDTPSPCSSPEFRAFDFWLGNWNVYGPKGNLAGTNNITREFNGCVLHEHYNTDRGYSGESFNIYDAPRKVWHQTWVDSSGLLLVLEGGIQNGKMVLSGQTTGTDDTITSHRITWTPNDDGSVRQFWESTNANGDWEVAFDGKYVRK